MTKLLTMRPINKTIQLQLFNDGQGYAGKIGIDYKRQLLCEIEHVNKLPDVKERVDWLVKIKADLNDEIDDILEAVNTRETKAKRSFNVFNTCFISDNEHLAEQALIDKILKLVDKLYWYDKDLLMLYLEEGSFRKLTELTGIPHQSIWNTVKATLKKLKTEITNDAD